MPGGMPRCWPIWFVPIGTITGSSPGTPPDAEAIKVLARTHQSLIWARIRHGNIFLRSALREYYPAALEAFDSLTGRGALAILGRAPPPPSRVHG